MTKAKAAVAEELPATHRGCFHFPHRFAILLTLVCTSILVAAVDAAPPSNCHNTYITPNPRVVSASSPVTHCLLSDLVEVPRRPGRECSLVNPSDLRPQEQVTQAIAAVSNCSHFLRGGHGQVLGISKPGMLLLKVLGTPRVNNHNRKLHPNLIVHRRIRQNTKSDVWLLHCRNGTVYGKLHVLD